MAITEKEKEQNNYKLWIKALVIFGICTIMFIPQIYIRHLIDERQLTRTEAQAEISQSWGGTQHIAGPAIILPNNTDSTYVSIFPSKLEITGNLESQTLRRGIFDFSVFNSPLTITGEFDFPKELSDIDLAKYSTDKAYLFVSLSDLRGLTDNATLIWDSEKHTIGSATSDSNTDIATGLTYAVNIQPILDGKKIRFNLHLPIKGSDGLYVAPVGNTNTITLKSDWNSPSFKGNFLPTSRDVSDSGFSATWKVLALNRGFGQVRTSSSSWASLMGNCELGADLHIPVNQYQQTTRTIKYAFLIILLTFAVIFFEDIYHKAHLHVIQYLLIGIALVLFYTLLLSISEHLSFVFAYLIAAIMTIGLITVFLAALFRQKRKNALWMGMMLCGLYAFLYILLQLESYALLVGSFVLFIILAVAMFVSIKVRNTR